MALRLEFLNIFFFKFLNIIYCSVRNANHLTKKNNNFHIILLFFLVCLYFINRNYSFASQKLPKIFIYSPFDEGPLIEPERFSDVREFCRCGITNFGAGCGVHCGWIELADCCLANAGRFNAVTLVTWMDDDRVGAGTLLRGGIAGGGPRDVTELWDWTRGGICGGGACGGGGFPFGGSLERDVTLGARWRIADVTFDMDCEMELWVVCGWTGATDTVGFGAWIFTTVCVFAWDGDIFGGGLFWTCFGCWAVEPRNVWKSLFHFESENNQKLTSMRLLCLLLLLFHDFLCIKIFLLLMSSCHIWEDT